MTVTYSAIIQRRTQIMDRFCSSISLVCKELTVSVKDMKTNVHTQFKMNFNVTDCLNVDGMVTFFFPFLKTLLLLFNDGNKTTVSLVYGE